MIVERRDYCIRLHCPTCKLWRTHVVEQPGAACVVEPGTVLVRCGTCGRLTTMPRTFTCPRCGRTSHHLADVGEGYCGACHDWTGCTCETVRGQGVRRDPGCPVHRGSVRDGL